MHLSDPHFQDGTMPTLDATTMARIQVRDLINDGKLKFKDLDRPAEVEDSSRIKVEMMRQEKETPKEANFEKTTMSKEKVPIAKASSLSTTEGSKERSYEPNGKEEKMVLQDLV